MADVDTKVVKDRFVLCGKTGDISGAKLLIISGIDVNATSSDKKCPFNYGTCLHLAVQYGREELVRTLLQCPDININSTNVYLDTPVIAAVRTNRALTLQMLLAHGDADLNHRSTWLATAYKIAKGTNNNLECARVIEEYLHNPDLFVEKFACLLTTPILPKPKPDPTRIIWDGGNSSIVIPDNYKKKGVSDDINRPATSYDLEGRIVRDDIKDKVGEDSTSQAATPSHGGSVTSASGGDGQGSLRGRESPSKKGL